VQPAVASAEVEQGIEAHVEARIRLTYAGDIGPSGEEHWRFRLALPAPAGYAFQLFWNGKSIATDDPADPSRIELTLASGEERRGLDLVLVRSRWEQAAGESPGTAASCP